jgi:hypothetical protein
VCRPTSRSITKKNKKYSSLFQLLNFKWLYFFRFYSCAQNFLNSYIWLPDGLSGWTKKNDFFSVFHGPSSKNVKNTKPLFVATTTFFLNFYLKEHSPLMPIVGESFCPNVKNLSKLEKVFWNQTFSAQPNLVNPTLFFHNKNNCAWQKMRRLLLNRLGPSSNISGLQQPKCIAIWSQCDFFSFVFCLND